jgi:cysteine desulfurase/selenocysteine lyase
MSKPATPSLDFDSIRQEFPILTAAQVTGRPPLVYLDSASTTQKPRCVIEALADFYSGSNANIHRGIYELSRRASELYERARVTVAAFINAPTDSECIFVRNTTEGINLVARSLQQDLGPGDLLVSTALEHHSNLVPWQLAAQSAGAELALVEVAPNGELDFDHLVSLLERRPRILAITHCSNVLGTIQDIQGIVQLAHRFEVPVLVDGAQSTPHFPVDVQELDCDFFVFSGHKALGPTGIGVLYGKRALLEAFPPFLGGGGMIRRVEDRESTWASLPGRFEAGTPAIGEAIALAAALDYLSELGRDRILAHERQLAEHARDGLSSIPGLTIYGRGDGAAPSGTLSFSIAGIPERHIVEVLDRHNVAVRGGQHCCQPLMRRLGIDATVRASFYLYNTERDVDRFVSAVQEAVETPLSTEAAQSPSPGCANVA